MHISLLKRSDLLNMSLYLRQTAFILMFFIFLISGCHKEEQIEAQPMVVQLPEMSSEIYLPTTMWDKVTGSSFEAAAKKSMSFNFTALNIILEEKTKGVLVSPVIQIELANGGGEIDLSKYIQSDKGTFRVKFNYDGFDTPDTLQVYYISKGKKRRIDQEVYGSGCKEYFDLKNYLLKVNSKEGIEVNVTRDRHISVLAGHFLFSHKKDQQTFLSQVTFTDSKRSDLFCDPVQRNENKGPKI